MAINPDHFAAPGKRVESAHEPGQLGTVLAWIEASDEIVVKWDSLDFAVVTYAHDLEPAESEPARIVHLMSANLLDACGKAPEGGGLTTTPVLGNVTCPDCKTLSVVPYQEARVTTHDSRCTLDSYHEGECNVSAFRG